MSVMMTGLFATLFYIPLFLQEGLGYPALRAGLLLLPQALVMAVLMPVAGRLYDKIGPRYLAFFGLVIAAIGTFLLMGISPDMTRGELVLLALHPRGRHRPGHDADHDRRAVRRCRAT